MVKKCSLLLSMVFALLLLSSGMTFAQDEINEFFFDGCSSIAPEGTWENPNLWCECCLAHDIAYWKGGTWKDRRNADKNLGKCVAQKTDKALGFIFYMGVRMGGSPYINTPYRWGYGWDFGRGYTKMKGYQKIVADEKIDEWLSENDEACGCE